MIEKCIEVFMDDFSVFGSSFYYCLTNLDLVLRGDKSCAKFGEMSFHGH